ncbi:hypothetical protein TorRG33x02_018750, partial [Trema orientale]
IGRITEMDTIWVHSCMVAEDIEWLHIWWSQTYSYSGGDHFSLNAEGSKLGSSQEGDLTIIIKATDDFPRQKKKRLPKDTRLILLKYQSRYNVNFFVIMPPPSLAVFIFLCLTFYSLI